MSTTAAEASLARSVRAASIVGTPRNSALSNSALAGSQTVAARARGTMLRLNVVRGHQSAISLVPKVCASHGNHRGCNIVSSMTRCEAFS